MALGRKAVLIAAIAAMSGCSGSTAPLSFSEFERPRDDFNRRIIPQDDPPAPPAEEVEFFPPEDEGGG